jgi:hypothetical protein
MISIASWQDAAEGSAVGVSPAWETRGVKDLFQGIGRGGGSAVEGGLGESWIGNCDGRRYPKGLEIPMVFVGK